MDRPRSFLRRALAACALILACTPPIHAQSSFIVLASTTSTDQSGLFTHLLPTFTKQTGIEVRVIALGTGQALDAARRGDADAVLVHDLEAERRFVAEGFAPRRHDVMYNDFVIVGPAADPAGIAGLRDAPEALRRIAKAEAPFVSRGDRSGTHAAELRMWSAAGLDMARPPGPWYRSTGSGMGPALNTASAMNGYILTDRGTWLSFKNRGTLKVLVEGDRRLFNPYGVMRVDPARHPHVRHEAAQRFVDWLVSPAGQEAIASFRVGGEQLFFPSAGG